MPIWLQLSVPARQDMGNRGQLALQRTRRPCGRATSGITSCLFNDVPFMLFGTSQSREKFSFHLLGRDSAVHHSHISPLTRRITSAGALRALSEPFR